tara:strand:+ start:49630 stop:49782 length:153 start_codon:yes stop_codon:yes gene_type:complete
MKNIEKQVKKLHKKAKKVEGVTVVENIIVSAAEDVPGVELVEFIAEEAKK